MRYCIVLITLFFISCCNKEDLLLPKSDVTIIADVQDHSPIYLFFRTNGKDTLVEVNRKNSIITTNWILNIDKRLPLRLVIPELMKLQNKKRKEKAHKNEKAENYFSYADSIGKNLAFVPFTKVYYQMKKPKGAVLFFTKNNEIIMGDRRIKKEEIKNLILSVLRDKPNTKFMLCFDKNLCFKSYLQDKILLKKLKIKAISEQEFVY
ncbi:MULTISPECIES: hypothetical protein [unclassified Flavobacterium]|uniref:hypothetical protein n=1 Tax=unclassified Flavobacterium TaxID=196869 RepID=UPI003F9330AC